MSTNICESIMVGGGWGKTEKTLALEDQAAELVRKLGKLKNLKKGLVQCGNFYIFKGTPYYHAQGSYYALGRCLSVNRSLKVEEKIKAEASKPTITGDQKEPAGVEKLEKSLADIGRKLEDSFEFHPHISAMGLA